MNEHHANTNRFTVVFDEMAQDPKALHQQIHSSFQALSLPSALRRAKAIFIKPNLTAMVYSPGVTTRIDFIRCLVGVIAEISPELTVYIGEGEGGYNSFSMSDTLEETGFMGLEAEFSQVKVVNLSRMPSREISVDTLQCPYRIRLPEIFFTEIDFSISCPVPKVHCMTGVTLSYKNLWGCLPDAMRIKNHYMFDFLISKVAEILKFRYAFLDGRYGLNRNGPMVGDPIELNWFAASNSLGAFDMIVTAMMGFDWRKIGHLRMADRYGFMPGREEIQMIGQVESLKRKFFLKREFWNYPALAAFHSKRLTHLFYFSKLADPLHRIMYAFRKRP